MPRDGAISASANWRVHAEDSADMVPIHGRASYRELER
jgi:hypothetical protein